MNQQKDKLEIGESSESSEKAEELIIIDDEDIEYKYIDTALDAASSMPVDGTLEVIFEFVYDQMTLKHPEIAWGVEVLTDYNPDTSFMLTSADTSQFLDFEHNNIRFTVFALKDKRDEKKY